MTHAGSPSRLALALLATTTLTQPGPARAAPGDALGGEFQVNSFATGIQSEPTVAMDADGDFVVVWTDYSGRDGWSLGIYARRFDAAGLAQGPDFQVNTYTSRAQTEPAVAMDAEGNFVIVWESDGQDASGSVSVYARHFDAAGDPRGPEFQVNSFTTGSQLEPSVAMDAEGNFVIVWESDGQDASLSTSVFAQRFDAAGIPAGSEFQVNSFTTGFQTNSVVAMNAAGDFVVAWEGPGSSDDSGVFAQRFDAAGVPQGTQLQVNSFGTGDQGLPDVAMDADGDFIVAWQSAGQDEPGNPSGTGIFAQRFNAHGVAQGPEFQVNSFTTLFQAFPAVAMDVDGDFVVAWESLNQDGDGAGSFAQRFDAAGLPQGPEFRVNSVTTAGQIYPTTAMDADGDFVVTWMDQHQDGDFWGIFAQRYDGAERVEGDFDGDGNADLLWRNTTTGNAIIWLMEGTESRAVGSIGIVPVDWEVAGTGDFNGDGRADILWRHTGDGSTVIWQMDGLAKVDSAGIGKPPLDWVVEQLRDTDGDGNSDILWRNSTTGTTLVWRMSGFAKTIVGSPGGAGAEWQVQ